jgi:hypothetical protein
LGDATVHGWLSEGRPAVFVRLREAGSALFFEVQPKHHTTLSNR